MIIVIMLTTLSTRNASLQDVMPVMTPILVANTYP